MRRRPPRPAGAVWAAWVDPREMERWWGPPTWPATSTAHDLRVGGRSASCMSGPDGERAHGWWEVLAVDEPRSLDLRDGSCDADGVPEESMPTSLTRVEREPAAGGTRMTFRSRYPDAEAMDQLVALGMVEGMTSCLEQLREQLGPPPGGAPG